PLGQPSGRRRSVSFDHGAAGHFHSVDELAVRPPRRGQRLPLQHQAERVRGQKSGRGHALDDTGTGSFSAAGAETFTTGSEKKNVVPARSLLSTQITPPWRSTICLVM